MYIFKALVLYVTHTYMIGCRCKICFCDAIKYKNFVELADKFLSQV
jgi:hypothetical protein